MSQPTVERLLPIAQVREITGAGTSTIYRWMSQDRFPRPISVTPGTRRWRESDLIAWQQAKFSTAGTS
ncbi:MULTISPECIES: helix-turn-helix transcriptional regulator [unclassified Novosphingobium]|uniref:helix-turn-helix transcriptional regulator n=1 Tax=unclassified Novosphingobium TaxID=2644732 RepID=UPI00086E580D|nr:MULTISPECIES: AlpA family phage regulatory protein [unclassified Novosphingobium]MBN9143706.1 AlpA family phage regulatory protein [Novosphingobium sp.]ODU84321.1 MAG: hypothetical protein ABT10_02755 [Novosphingobium sp. SCN 63-17]OJX92862.1 MAG: hypothetical protein BGP00_23360 [Novosphingobium sp. 63-713]